MGESELYAVGKVVRAHGVAGEVVVEPLTDDPDRFLRLSKVILEAELFRELKIKSVRRHRARVIICFDGIGDRDQAEELIGRFLLVTRSDLVELPEDAFFHFELIGMEVYSDSGEFVGTIKEVWKMPANDVWVVAGRGEILIPAVKQIVREVDREAKRVTIRVINGLLNQ